jgi:hypothetical protein
VIAEAIQLFRFLPFIDLGSGCQGTACHREKNGQEPRLAIRTLSATLPMVRLPVFAVTVLVKTVRRRLLIVEAVARKDFRRSGQLLSPKHSL